MIERMVGGAGASAASAASSAGVGAVVGVGVGAAQGGAVAMPFGGVLQAMVQETGALDAKASQAVTGLLSGKGVEVHEAMMATEKASMAFELALQVRNKAVGAYQQMMAMQF